jgi:TRAP-type uncharacterized transport system fused permease subunit
MRTSVESFRIGLAAFIVPFMFFFSPGLLMEGDWLTIARNLATALVGVWLLSAAATGYLLAPTKIVPRLSLLVAALLMIAGGIATDAAGVVLGAATWFWQRRVAAA